MKSDVQLIFLGKTRRGKIAIPTYKAIPHTIKKSQLIFNYLPNLLEYKIIIAKKL